MNDSQLLDLAVTAVAQEVLANVHNDLYDRGAVYGAYAVLYPLVGAVHGVISGPAINERAHALVRNKLAELELAKEGH